MPRKVASPRRRAARSVTRGRTRPTPAPKKARSTPAPQRRRKSPTVRARRTTAGRPNKTPGRPAMGRSPGARVPVAPKPAQAGQTVQAQSVFVSPVPDQGQGAKAITPFQPWWTQPERGQAAPRSASSGSERDFSIPSHYGEDRVVVMVKDPWWLFAYWEIQPATERAARGQLLPNEVAGLQTVLRVYDVTGFTASAAPTNVLTDIALSAMASNWYIPLQAPERVVVIEIGLLTQGGRFITLARSNRVTTPRNTPAQVIDPHWSTTEEEFLTLASLALARPGSSRLGKSRPSLEPLVPLGASSPSSWGSSRQPAVRSFWCRVDTELILYGGTEPRATVHVQGQPIPVRKDGTFSVRLALPEGTQTITVDVRSPDGRQSRTVTPIVSRTAAVPPSGGTSRSSEAEHRDERRSTGDAEAAPAP